MTDREDESVKARFDRLAATWDANPGRVALARAVADAIRAAVPLAPDLWVADIGAGTGLLTLALLPFVGRMTAVDASPEMLRVLAGKAAVLPGGAVETLGCDLEHAVPPLTGLDGMVSSMMLHHIRDVPALFRRLRPCLRSGGWLAMADLDTEDGSFHADKTGVHHNGFSRDDVCAWLKQAGFVNPAARDAYRLSRPAADGTLRVYPIFLVTARVP